MKELTFREVIANIKEGEVWESEMVKIFIDSEEKDITILKKEGFFYCEAIGIKYDIVFKLKRPQYTFQEAFEAFEEGKEIESCYNNEKFKGESVFFHSEQIKGKWYIND